MPMLQQQQPDDTVQPVKNAATPIPAGPPTIPSLPPASPGEGTSPNDPSLVRSDYTDGGTGGGGAAPITPPPIPATPINPSSIKPLDTNGMTPTGVPPLSLPPMPDQSATPSVPAGVDPGWWNSSGLSTFQGIFQQNFGRQATPDEIAKYGGQAAAMSWDAVPDYLKAQGITPAPAAPAPAPPIQTMGNGEPPAPPPETIQTNVPPLTLPSANTPTPAPSGTMGSGNPVAAIAIAPAPIQTEGPGQAPSTPTPAPAGTMGSGGTPTRLTPGQLQALLASLTSNTSTTPSTSTIDPANDLRSQVINTGPSARTTAAQSATDAAAKGLTTDATKLAADQTTGAEAALGVSPDKVAGANTQVQTAFQNLSDTDRQKLTDSLIQQYMGQVAPDARLTGLQGQVDSAASDLAGVDRYKLAQDKFSTYADQTDPAFQKSLRDIMDREAGMGGFTGRLNTSYGDAGLMRERDLSNERDTLFQNALEGSIQDAFGKESALSGLEGQLSSEDLNRFSTAANFGSTNASADVGALESRLAGARGVAGDMTAAEEAAQQQGSSRAQQQLNTEQTNLSARAGLESQSVGEDANQADQLRTERGYQVGQEDEAYQRAVAEHQQEQQDQMTAFEREMSLLGAGDAGNPAGEIGALSAQINPGLDMATLAQLAGSAGASSVPGGTPGGGIDGGIDWAALLRALTPTAGTAGATGSATGGTDDGQ